MEDVQVHAGKPALIAEGRKNVDIINEDYESGLLSEEERYEKTVEAWQDIVNRVQKLVPDSMEKDGPVYDMVISGARGSIGQISQMSGMKGLIAQDAVVSELDCKVKEGITLTRKSASGIEIPLSRGIKGRILAKDVVTKSGDIVYKKGILIHKKEALDIENSDVESVEVFSPLACKSIYGVCQKCYGLDLARNNIVKTGEAIGIVAAQAIGEPGTQLTMRTFHAGGVAGVDITQGLPRVEEIFERRMPKSPAVVSHTNGEVMGIKQEGKEKTIVVLSAEGEKGGKKGTKEIEYSVPFRRIIQVKVGDQVKRGQVLTDGSADIEELFKYAGKDAAGEYIISEVNKIYELQGSPVSRKHIEVIIRQMFGRVRIKESGDTKFTQGDLVERSVYLIENMQVEDKNLTPAKGEPVVLGITDVSLSTESWLSSASFQNTTRVLIGASVRGTTDRLRGLKENVIIGRLIPAGTGSVKESEKEEEKSIKENI